MSEFRFDPFRGDQVLLAPKRSTTPRSKDVLLPEPPGTCPFCPGNEPLTDETLARWPAEGDWTIRVVANRYPAAQHHEVIVEGPEHDLDLLDYPADRMSGVLRAYRSRVRVHAQRDGIVHLFRNRGIRAGSSQPHPHAQLLVADKATAEVNRRWQRMLAHHNQHNDTLMADYLRDECGDGRRIIDANDQIVVLCPIAPRFSYETWIVPRTSGGFATTADATLDAVADALADVLPRVMEGRHAYNLVFRSPANAHASHPAAFWMLEILPRFVLGAGYEQSSGSALVSVSPEDAAADLRL